MVENKNLCFFLFVEHLTSGLTLALWLLQISSPSFLQQRNKEKRSSSHSFMNCILIPFFKAGSTDYNEEGQSDLETYFLPGKVIPNFLNFFSFFLTFTFRVSFQLVFKVNLFLTQVKFALFLEWIWKWGMNMDGGETRILPMLNHYV